MHGLDLSSVVTDPTSIVIRAGSCRDDGDAITLVLANGASQTLASLLDQGSVQANRDYFVFLIGSGSAVHGLASLSVANPKMPSGYSYKRYLGVVKTDSGASVCAFAQTDDYFELVSPISVCSAQPGSLARLPMKVPPGAHTLAKFWVQTWGADGQLSIKNPAICYPVPYNQTGSFSEYVLSREGAGVSAEVSCDVDPDGFVWFRDTAGTNAGCNINLRGWYDTRRADARALIDVVTVGTSLTDIGGWQHDLEDRLNAISSRPVVVRNFGVSASHSADTLTRVGQIVDARPNIVLIEVSMNDASITQSPSVSQAQSQANISAIVSAIQAGSPNTHIFLMKMNMCLGAAATERPNLSQYYAINDTVASGFTGVDVIDNTTAYGTLATGDYQDSGGLHPLPATAYTKMNPNIVRVIGSLVL